MKTAFKKIFSNYLNTWWLPPLLFVVTVSFPFVDFARGFNGATNVMGVLSFYIFMVCFYPMSAGVFFSWIAFMMKKRWDEALWSFLFFIALNLSAAYFFL